MAPIRLRWRLAGFTYLGLIIFVTVIGLVGAATLKVDSLLRRAAAEEELLDAGAAFGAALQSYAAATPQGQPPVPPTLKELLKDPRFPYVRRHLRKIPVDPMTGKTEWGIVYLHDDSGVLAVYSLSNAKPLKIANFDARFRGFENKKHISDWKFSATGQGLLRPDQVPAPPPLPPPAPALSPSPSPAGDPASPEAGPAASG